MKLSFCEMRASQWVSENRNQMSDLCKSKGNFDDLFRSVSRCSISKTFKFFQCLPLCMFSISIYYSCIVSIAAALIIAVPCDLSLACSQPSPGAGTMPIVPQPEHHRSPPTEQKSGRCAREGSNWVDHAFRGRKGLGDQV